MEQDDKFTPLHPVSPIRPLYLRRKPTQVHVAASKQQHEHEINKVYTAQPNASIFPPRSTSLRNSKFSIVSGGLHRGVSRTSPISVNAAQSTSLSSEANHLSSTSTHDAQSIDTTLSTVSSIEGYYLSSNSSSAILGDFIPVDTMEATPDTGIHDSLSRVNRPANPYEFEPITPYVNEARQTTISDFIRRAGQETSPTSIYSPQPFHTKNSLSEGNKFYVPQRSRPLAEPLEKPGQHMLHRSESSPVITPLRSQAFGDGGERSEFAEFGGEGRTHESSTRWSHRRPGDNDYRGRRYSPESAPQSLPSRSRHGFSISQSRSPSPTRVQSPNEDLYSSSPRGRQRVRSPTKALDDVSEQDEIESRRVAAAMSPPLDPIKRSRSPMKKMFGEHGWLGQSPNELQDVKHRSKPSSLPRNEDSNSHHKKPGMIGRIKNKFEEFAEKADINSKRSSIDKHPGLPMLAISLSPPEQAQISMELELMLVHTANSFLMNEFSRGRMAVDSIKRTVDKWKAKGRPGVIEFMYDQKTQREVVVANQHTFRFHGERACDVIRVDSMLYNWKQVANLMAVRTFCNADTVILKLLFDIEQILELLGAPEPIMIRIQQVRARVNGLIRMAREKKESKQNGLQSSSGESSARDTHSTVGSQPKGMPSDDPYGGLKLVPDSYPNRA